MHLNALLGNTYMYTLLNILLNILFNWYNFYHYTFLYSLLKMSQVSSLWLILPGVRVTQRANSLSFCKLSRARSMRMLPTRHLLGQCSCSMGLAMPSLPLWSFSFLASLEVPRIIAQLRTLVVQDDS